MLRFIDSFDTIGDVNTSSVNVRDHLLGKWSTLWTTSGTPTFGLDTGKYGGYSLTIDSTSTNTTHLVYTIPGVTASTMVAGFYFKYESDSTNRSTILEFQDLQSNVDGGYVQAELRLDNTATNRKIEVYTAGVLRATTASAITAGRWYYIEFKCTFHNTTGSWELRINEATSLSGSSVDTSLSGNAWATSVAISGGINKHWFDDFYFLDSATGRNTSFLNESQVTALKPATDNTTDWTPSANGSHYALVDEITDVDFTDYLETNTNGNAELFNMESLSQATAVYGLQVCAALKSTASDAKTVATIASYGGNESAVNAYLGTGDTGHWDLAMQVCEYQPGTSTDWTNLVINATLFGVEKVA